MARLVHSIVRKTIRQGGIGTQRQKPQGSKDTTSWILQPVWCQIYILCVCVLLGLGLWAYTLSHSTSSFLWRVFSRYSHLPRLALNCYTPDLCLLSC
jgi:type VI protein secretion system component VasF